VINDYHLFINRDLPPLERGCTSKVWFASQAEARSVSRTWRHASGSLRPYHCRFADHWHVGHRRHAHG
jgi:hypothetical protein